MTTQKHTIRPEGLSRRQVVGKALAFGAVALTADVIGKVATVKAQEVGAESHPEERYVTTSALNLRTGPSSSHKVILVMPKGATVTLQQRYENGYHYVSYKGQLGWAHHDYLVKFNDANEPVIIGEAVTTSNVNLRSGPSTGQPVIRVIAKGVTVDITDRVQNGYRYIFMHFGPGGWVIDSALRRVAQPGETFTTTARLNLRAEPSTSAKVLLVMPQGATVKALAGNSNGFRQVSYNGTTGWAATAYLN